MIFHTKNAILGKYLYVSYTLFILYLKGNHTLFGEKLYFIWKVSSGNTVTWQTFRTGLTGESQELGKDARRINEIPGRSPFVFSVNARHRRRCF